jgi:hypothetical protein
MGRLGAHKKEQCADCGISLAEKYKYRIKECSMRKHRNVTYCFRCAWTLNQKTGRRGCRRCLARVASHVENGATYGQCVCCICSELTRCVKVPGVSWVCLMDYYAIRYSRSHLATTTTQLASLPVKAIAHIWSYLGIRDAFASIGVCKWLYQLLDEYVLDTSVKLLFNRALFQWTYARSLKSRQSLIAYYKECVRVDIALVHPSDSVGDFIECVTGQPVSRCVFRTGPTRFFPVDDVANVSIGELVTSIRDVSLYRDGDSMIIEPRCRLRVRSPVCMSGTHPEVDGVWEDMVVGQCNVCDKSMWMRRSVKMMYELELILFVGMVDGRTLSASTSVVSVNNVRTEVERVVAVAAEGAGYANCVYEYRRHYRKNTNINVYFNITSALTTIDVYDISHY